MEKEGVNNNALPFDIVDLEQKVADELMQLYKGERTGFVRIGPSGYFMPQKYRENAADIYNMQLRPTDVFVTSFPRSGTTWTQELVWLVANDLDYDTAARVPIEERYTFLEFSTFFHPEILTELMAENSDNPKKLQMLKEITTPGVQFLSAMTTPRFIKTHMALSLLPPELLTTAKTVYVARDPRDSAVSFYYLSQAMRLSGYKGDFPTFWRTFIKDLNIGTPYFAHIKEAWAKRDSPNMLFLFYEELIKDLPAVVGRVSKFLDKSYSAEEVQRLCQHLSFDSCKNNKSVNHNILCTLGIMDEKAFIRKGKSGGWRDYFDEAMTREADVWIRDNLRGSDLRFPHMPMD